MNSSMKTVAISALGGLIAGLLLGFIPAHMDNSKLQEQNASLAQAKAGADDQFNLSQRRLQVSSFAVRSAQVSAEADANNYSVASAGASGLFTDLRRYVDANPKSQTTQQIAEVLNVRDEVIAGLAQANPAIKPLLQQLFAKMESISVATNQTN